MKRSEPPPTLLWLRNALRLSDNPALIEALRPGGPVIPVYILVPDEEEGGWPMGGASRWWLGRSLGSLAADLRRRGSRLVLARGGSLDILADLAARVKATRVVCDRRWEPAAAARDAGLRRALGERGVSLEAVNASLLSEPGALLNRSGRPFQVFTPYAKAFLAATATAAPRRPAAAPRRIAAPSSWPASLPPAALELEPRVDWAGGLRAAWSPGERGAKRALSRFVRSACGRYDRERDLPGAASTSRLSPHLHFGEIGPGRIRHAIEGLRRRTRSPRARRASEAFLRQIVWREFAHQLLWHHPRAPLEPLRPAFASFPWRRDAGALRAWRKGRTGYPIVDAGMRELWRTGWMHNRVRMIAASFLVKDLLIRWQEGARWFWDALVDADLANNTLGWQWVAGCGADAAPFFRIFHPVLQGEKLDARGRYVRRWVPELARLPDRWIHRPWEAPAETLAGAGVALGRTYPEPIVSHAAARVRALQALAATRRSGRGRAGEGPGRAAGTPQGRLPV